MRRIIFLYIITFLHGWAFGQTVRSGLVEIVRIDSFSPQYDFKNPENVAPGISDTIVVMENGVPGITVINRNTLFKTFERSRDTTIFMFTDEAVLGYSNDRADNIVRYCDFSRMQSYNYRPGSSGYEKYQTYRMFEDWRLPAEELINYQEDRSRTMEVAGIAGFYVAYRFRTQKGEKLVKGYISDKAAFPLALASPRNRKVSFVPLYLEEYLVEKPENKHIVQLIDLQKIRKSEVEKQIRGYTGDK